MVIVSDESPGFAWSFHDINTSDVSQSIGVPSRFHIRIQPHPLTLKERGNCFRQKGVGLVPVQM
jgi:hypothetical protein